MKLTVFIMIFLVMHFFDCRFGICISTSCVHHDLVVYDVIGYYSTSVLTSAAHEQKQLCMVSTRVTSETLCDSTGLLGAETAV